MKVGFISLGCNKNLVDTEKTIALFQNHQYEIVNRPEIADIIVINTCGFIASAKEEAIDTILEMVEYKKKNCKYLIVMGCLVERYKEELQKSIPEVNLYIKYSSYDTLWEQIEALISMKEEMRNSNSIDKKQKESKIKKAIKKEKRKTIDEIKLEKGKIENGSNTEGKRGKTFLEMTDRVITTGRNYAYLKIADGCSNCCTYCAIPKIRGPLKSRKLESILEEANKLAKEGYQEIILTAQDTTKYGVDIYGKPKLAELLTKLCKIEKIKWIRFLYAYPETITDDLIKVIKQNQKICHYFDIPIQHIATPVLKRMNRKSDGKSIRTLITKLRKEIPDVILRTTVMVGFPGETKENFEELYQFLEEAKFDKLGAFSYSKEEGTAAEKLNSQIHPSTKRSRYNQIMKLQQQISRKNLEQKIGKNFEVMIEGITENKKFYVGRSYMDTPEIDGVIYIENTKKLKTGEIVNCKITKVRDYDLVAILECN